MALDDDCERRLGDCNVDCYLEPGPRSMAAGILRSPISFLRHTGDRRSRIRRKSFPLPRHVLICHTKFVC